MNGERALIEIRRTILEMVFQAKEGHVPSAFSILEILYILYQDCLHYDSKNPKSEDRDYFILSKGHAGAGLYGILSHFGFLVPESLMSYCQLGSIYGGHPDTVKVPGVEVSTGSLGHGIAMAVGIAYGLRIKKSPRKVVVLVGDGEMDEGSFWESIMLAKNLSLSNLVVIADCNQSQKYSHRFEYAKIISSFGWETLEVDGHDLKALSKTLQPLVHDTQNGPTFLVAHTTKGYGVQRFIGEHGWHRRTPTPIEMAELREELS
jgi:transketolase